MKRVLGLVIAIVLVLSVSASFAVVTTYNAESLVPYLGMWLYKGESNTTVLSIGYNSTLELYVVEYTSSMESQKYGSVAGNGEFELTYDKGADMFYLTRDATTVSYKMKLVDGKIVLTDMFGRENIFEKIQ